MCGWLSSPGKEREILWQVTTSKRRQGASASFGVLPVSLKDSANGIPPRYMSSKYGLAPCRCFVRCLFVAAGHGAIFFVRVLCEPVIGVRDVGEKREELRLRVHRRSLHFATAPVSGGDVTLRLTFSSPSVQLRTLKAELNLSVNLRFQRCGSLP